MTGLEDDRADQGGIGSATALAFAREGAGVVVAEQDLISEPNAQADG